jgi:quercetin dioxygenase-like cupin family protein
VHHAPGASIDLHRTDSIDCDTVLGGHVELGLEAGSVLLEPGDLVLIPGLAHRWLAGDEGSTLSVVLVGLEP